MRLATSGRAAAQVTGAALLCGQRRLERRQAGAGARVLARAFADDPLNVQLVPDRARRQEVLAIMFEFWLRFGCRKGHVCASSGRLEGIAVWFESERLRMSLWSALRCGGLRVVHGVEHGLLVQYQRFERLVRNVQARIVPEPHVYLSTLAVDPEHQGRGHGRELMKAVLEQAEQAGRVCYLETELERNVGFYRRFGFEVADELVVPGTTVVVRAMIRRPVLGSGAGGAGSA